MTDFTNLLERLRDEHSPPWQVNPAAKIAADAIEAQAKRIAELEAALNKWQKWWEMPWQDRRPDMADLCHMKARKVLGEKE